MSEHTGASARFKAVIAAVTALAVLNVACAASGRREGAPSPDSASTAVIAVATAVPTAPSTLAPAVTVTPMAQVAPSKTPGVVRRSAAATYFVGNTLGRGMVLRPAPGLTEAGIAWPDGAKMDGLGAEQDVNGWTWVMVRDPDGKEGWIPANYLLRTPTEPTAAATVAPHVPNLALTPTPIAVTRQATTSAPTPIQQSGSVSVEPIYQGFVNDQRTFVAAALVRNSTGATRVDVRIRFDALDPAGVVVGSTTDTLPPLPAGADFTEVLYGRTNAENAQVKTVRSVIESVGRTPRNGEPALQPLFTVADVQMEKYETRFTRNRNAYRVEAVVKNFDREVERSKVAVSYVFRDATGKVIGAARRSLLGSFPEVITPSMSLRVDSGPVDMVGTPSQVDVHAHYSAGLVLIYVARP